MPSKRAEWETKQLSEVCDIERGGSPRPIDSFLTDDPSGINWIKIGDTKGITKYICQTQEKIRPEGAKRSRIVVEGDFILSNSMSFGRPYIMKTTGCIHDGWLLLRPKEPRINQDFLYYVLGSDLIFRQFDLLAAGSTVRNLNIGLVKTVRIPVPPKSEQERIVAILDEAFEGIAAARANAQQCLIAAHELLTNFLDMRFAELSSRVASHSIGEIADVKGGKRTPNGYKLETQPTPYPYLRVADFSDDGSIDQSDLRYISEAVHAGIKNYVISSRDLYISIAGTIGKTGIIPPELEGAQLTENACRLVFKDLVSNRFVYLFTRSSWFAGQMGLNTRTTAQPKLALSRLATIKVPVPALIEQKELVDQAKLIAREVKRLASIYEQKLSSLEALKQSILDQAFSGKL